MLELPESGVVLKVLVSRWDVYTYVYQYLYKYLYQYLYKYQ